MITISRKEILKQALKNIEKEYNNEITDKKYMPLSEEFMNQEHKSMYLLVIFSILFGFGMTGLIFYSIYLRHLL